MVTTFPSTRPPGTQAIMSEAPRVLFLSPRREEYLADSVFHGLRSLLGDRVVDYPKHELMYSSCPQESIRRARGNGFTLYGLLDDIEIDRSRTLDEIHWGEFDLVIFGAIHDRFGDFVELYPELERSNTQGAVLDGADGPAMYPYGGRWWRQPMWWTLPRAHTRFPYFKRELLPETYRNRCFRLLSPSLASRLPILRGIRPISYAVPAEKIVSSPREKSQLFATHIVDEEVARHVQGTQSSYAFSSEADYYSDLQRSRFGITTRRAGWDALRHYEIAANGAVPCFRDLHAKPSSCAPHGLNETNCIIYSSYEDLRSQIDRLSDVHYEALQHGALTWARQNSTVERATQVLQQVQKMPHLQRVS
jgi:hypothetical protein